MLFIPTGRRHWRPFGTNLLEQVRLVDLVHGLSSDLFAVVDSTLTAPGRAAVEGRFRRLSNRFHWHATGGIRLVSDFGLTGPPARPYAPEG